MAELASTRVFGKLTVMHEAILKANAEIVGNVTAAKFIGDGSQLTALPWGQLTGVPSTFAPSSHTHPWGEVTGKPSTATRWPAWSEVTGKPTEFTPESHEHPWSEVTGKPATATRWPSWSEVSSKPSTFAPSSHSHDAGDLPNASTSARGVVQLNNSTTSTSTVQAATANAVKTANDAASSANSNANSRVAKSGDTMTNKLTIDNSGYRAHLDLKRGNNVAQINPSTGSNSGATPELRFEGDMAGYWFDGKVKAEDGFVGDGSGLTGTASLRATGTTKGDVGLSGIPNTNGSTANFLRGDGTWVTPPNTTYSEITTAEIDAGTASTRRTISGRRMKYALDKKADVSHTHTLSQITDAGSVAGISTNGSSANFLRGDGTWATPPNTNTTYSEITTAEIDAGTASTLRTISGRRMKYALDKKSDTGHGHVIGDVTGLQAAIDSKADTTTQVIAGTGLSGGGTLAANRTLSVTYGTAAGTAAEGNDSRLSNSREWTASTVSQAEAEAGTATTRRAWTAQRIAQAISALGLKIGTTASTAKAGNWTPTWSDVSSKPDTATRWPAWGEVTGKPSTFAPSSHGHAASEITGLSDAATTSIATIRSGTTASNVGLSKLSQNDNGVRITQNGSVDIGNRNTSHTHYSSSTGSHYFYGTITCAGNITAYSDRRVKENLEVIPDALDKVSQLTGYTYDRTDEDTPRQTGVVAQDVQAVLPEAVVEDPETGHLHVAYGNMVGLLIEAIKELKAEVNELKEKQNGTT